MDELLNKLLETELLSEDIKTELRTQITTYVEEAAQAAREEATVAVTTQLHETWTRERDVLIEALDARVSDALTAEIEELREDIERFRDLEAEHASKLVEAKQEMAQQLTRDIADLISELDNFIELRLAAEIDELREDIQTVRQQQFGRSVFEAFVNEFKSFYAGDDASAELNELKASVAELNAQLQESTKTIASYERSTKMNEVLQPLTGRTREVMEAILSTVATDKLDEAYHTYLSRVIRDQAPASTPEKEDKVLAEVAVEVPVTGTVVTGDDATAKRDQQIVEESHTQDVSELDRLRRLAGINVRK